MKMIARRQFLAVILAVLVLTGIGLQFHPVLSQSTEHAAYQITITDRTVFARNQSNGNVDFSGTDAATVIQNAIDALKTPRTAKERIRLIGSFSISNTIMVPSYTILEIQGTFTPALHPVRDRKDIKTTLIQNSDPVLGNTNIEIYSGILDGGLSNIAIDAIHFNGVTKSVIRDITIRGFAGRGIVLAETTKKNAACENITISNSRFEHMGLEAIRTIVLSELPATIGNKRITISGCTFHSNNEMPGDHYGAVHLDANTQDSLVNNCTFTNEKSAVEIDSAFRNVVSNSTIDTTWSSAIIIYQGPGPQEQPATLNHIVGNSIANAARAGVLIASDTAANLATQNTIEGNRITNCNTNRDYPYGAIAVEGSPNNIIVNNVIGGSLSAGIVLFPADWRKCDHTQISGNSVGHCWSSGIALGQNAASGIVISSNYCHDNSKYGISIDDGNSNTNVANNRLPNNTLGTIYNAGTNTQIIP